MRRDSNLKRLPLGSEKIGRKMDCVDSTPVQSDRPVRTTLLHRIHFGGKKFLHDFFAMAIAFRPSSESRADSPYSKACLASLAIGTAVTGFTHVNYERNP